MIRELMAMDKIQFGRHQYIILAFCGLIIASVSGPGSSLLENRGGITCNFMINYDQRMRINTYTIIALMIGGLVTAVPADFFSRLKALVVSLIFYGSATVALGFCRGYHCFVISSVFRAFWASALLPVTMVYVAELQPPRYRGSALCFLQVFWLLGLSVMPVLSITWRTSQFIFGTLSLVVTIPIAYYFTESPKLLLSLGRHEDALKSLRKIYRRNFPKSENEYPVEKLTEDFSPEMQDAIELDIYVPKAMRPPWYCPIVILQIGFVFQLCYFTMSYWFPEMQCRHVLLFRTIRGEVVCNHGEKSLSNKYMPPKEIGVYERNAANSCSSTDIDADYYKQALTVSLAALPLVLWMIMRVDYLGRSHFATFSHVIAGLLSFVVHFVIGTKYTPFYTCFMEIMWLISGTMSSCLAIEFSRTRYRVLSVALANSFGYMGMAMGMYGLLLQKGTGCIFVMSFAGIFATAGGFLTLSLPEFEAINLR